MSDVQQVRLPVHPGEILQKEFLSPLGLSATRLASNLHLHLQRVEDILKGYRPVNAEVALRLARFLGTSARFWMNAQVHYDLRMCEIEEGQQIDEEVVPVVATLKKASGAGA